MEGSSKDYRDEPDLELGPDSSKPASGSETPPSPKTAAAIRKEKGRVRFNSNAAVTSPPVIPSSPPPETRTTPIAKPRPSLLRGNSSNSVTGGTKDVDDGLDPESKEAMVAAQERARLIAANLSRNSSAISRDSLESSVGTAYDDRESTAGSNIPLQDLSHSAHNRDGFQKIPSGEHEHPTLKEEAFKLVRSHTNRFENNTAQNSPTAKEAPRQRRETLTELNDGNYDGVVYDLPEPEQYRGSVLSQLLKLYKPPEPPFKREHNRNASIASSIGGTSSPTVQGTPSGASTPTRKKWYNQNRSQDTLANLIEASARLANPNEGEQASDSKNGGKKHGRPPMHKRAHSANRLSGFWQQQEARITVHIAETLSRQDYIIKLCRALMLYGAPTHRLEEYLSMTARVLEIDGQFLYLPGCMIISFDDRSTHTTEVRIVRSAQGIDLGKLKDVHLIYKEVMHDCIGVEEATDKLDVLMKRKDKFHAWLRVIIFGLTSVTAAPFSFGARLIDLPLIFAFGCLVGVLQLIVAPNSALYSNVFEVTATVVVSFLARLFGSINNSNLFCFGALAQGGIVMLLPGYMVLCSSLELQSRAIVPGSIRIVYAIIYCLLLGFGITVGSALYGLFDDTPSNQATCENPMDPYYGFIFVPPFVVCISMIYQAKWRQVPIMVIIAFAGYMVNYWSGQRFKSSPQISSTLGALAVGVLANLYSRLRHGVAAAILIPAVFCQVPGGLASTGGLLSGLSVANELTNNNGTINGTASVQVESGGKLDNLVFNVAASMIQIAIGIAVGLFMSALIIYPLGKRRSGLFSF